MIGVFSRRIVGWALARHMRTDLRLPNEVLLLLVHGGPDQPPGAYRPPPVTADTRSRRRTSRSWQRAAATPTSHALSCSVHTVKNVAHDLMARLQVRNRAPKLFAPV